MWLGSMGIVTLRFVARPNRVVTSSLSSVTLRPFTTFVTRHCLGNVSKRVEDVMPIATGHELQHGMRFSTSVPNDPDTIFINGEFIGGSDIILNMHQNGELKEKLKGLSKE
ncbi:hypothetical protein L6452_10690 [Arctium lappa]|uniref:Uncharacterized protein n=1 Tax=Arctium lappa TaxID=4217 RepID=A0ACB9DMM2_ARCLA|nr:hypothetical protein L6452_10690 [Arctium lappa]